MDISGVKPVLEERMAKMAAAFKAETGKTLLVTSGYRSNEKQKELWDQKLAQTGGDAKAARKWVAEPAPPLGNGRGSAHMSGLALDINSKGAGGINQLAGPATNPTGWLEKFGLTRPVKHEDWHVQASGAKVTTPDNPDNPGKPIAVPDKTGKPVDVATGKNETIGPAAGVAGVAGAAAGMAAASSSGASNPEKSTPDDSSLSTPDGEGGDSGVLSKLMAKTMGIGGNGIEAKIGQAPKPFGSNTSSVPPVPTEPSPTKVIKDVALAAASADMSKRAKMETDTAVLKGSVETLTAELNKARATGNTAKASNIENAIKEKQGLTQTNAPGAPTVADKTLAVKDKTMISTEQTYSTAVSNTQSYDMKTSALSAQSSSPGGASSAINNGGRSAGKEEKTNPFELFDNLQEA